MEARDGGPAEILLVEDNEMDVEILLDAPSTERNLL